ncbi:MAG: malonyl-ACP O-methyltransferase BioC [Candidatus Saganbacteria bacterium]|nr:malonyl-ACP O-methyltransferase BioC [Candidatus Saganbacteria bacterium]
MSFGSKTKDIIRKRFSKYAKTYDKYAKLQKSLAEKLLKYLPETPAKDILDIGCGTGALTKLLREKFKSSHITALDISPEMVKIAKQKMDDSVEFMVADGEEMPDDKQYDLIASNATMQWFSNLDRTMAKYKKILKKEGAIAFTLFGPLTYHELSWVMEDVTNKKMVVNSKKFLGRPEIEAILKKHFKHCGIREEIVKEHHKTLRALLTKIKYSGTQGTSMAGNGLLGKDVLKKAEELYKRKYKNIQATNQLFFCWASQ